MKQSTSQLIWSKNPATSRRMLDIIENALPQIKAGGPAEISLFYEIAYPEDLSDYTRMDGNAIILVTAITHSKDQLPLKSVSVQTEKERIELKLIRMALADLSDSESLAVKTLGSYREDALYLLPMQLRITAGILMVDFAKNIPGRQAGTLGSPVSKELAELASHPTKGVPPSAEIVENFVAKEFSMMPAEGPLSFSLRVTECLNHWAAFPHKANEDQFSFGFIYVDEERGFTNHLGGTFKIDAAGRFIKTPGEDFDRLLSVKVRIENNGIAAILPQEAIAQLGLPGKPDWLKNYDDGMNSPYHRMKVGYWMNEIGDSQRALPLLESAYNDDPSTKGLAVELAFTYNALKKYDKAIGVLKIAVKEDPANIALGKELAYATMNAGDDKEAIDLYLHFISICPDDQMEFKCEMAINLASAYKQIGLKEEAAKWLDKAKSWAPKGSRASQLLKKGS